MLGLLGKAKKQEIRRVHNSNPLQRHSHVQMLSLAIYKVMHTDIDHVDNVLILAQFIHVW